MRTFLKNLFNFAKTKTNEEIIDEFKTRHESDILKAMAKLHNAIENQFPCYEESDIQITLDWLTCPAKQFKIQQVKDIVMDESGYICIQVDVITFDGSSQTKNLRLLYNIDRASYDILLEVLDLENPHNNQGQIKQFLIKASLLSEHEVELMFHGHKTWKKLQQALKYFNINVDEKV